MEQQRVSTSSPPAAPAQRSKAPAPTRPAEGAADDPATAGGFSSLLSALGDGAVQEVLQPDAVLPAGDEAGAALLAWQGPDAWKPLPSAVAQGGSLATLSLADAAQRAGLLGAELLGQGGLVAQTAKIDAALELPAAQGQGGAVAGYQRAFARLENVLSQGTQSAPGMASQALTPGRQPAGADRQGALAFVAGCCSGAACAQRCVCVAFAGAVVGRRAGGAGCSDAVLRRIWIWRQCAGRFCPGRARRATAGRCACGARVACCRR